jgi:hypothetical protein
MSKLSNVASWKGSPFAVAVMFLGNGFGWHHPTPGCQGYAISWALPRPSLYSRWSAWELDRSLECRLRGGLWAGIPHE